MEPSSPRLVGGRYEIVNRIGAGGTATVYLARDTLLARNVAVKLLNEVAAADPSFVERFRREARAAAALNHPNVVTVYDWGEAPAQEGEAPPLYFLVMEYVPGHNLKDLIRRNGPLPEGDALDIAAQVASALEAAHQIGLVHRDVKPHNVLLDPFGRAKVTDFGIAHAAGLSQLTTTNAVSGTAHYLSPEQAQRRPLDGRSDLYSLGVVLYEMLTGRVPFEGDSLVDVALQHVRQQPPSPRTLRPDLSPAAESIVSRALAKDPAERFGSAGEMHRALEDARARLRPPAEAEGDTTVIGTFAQADATTLMPRRGTTRMGSLPPGPRPRLRPMPPERRTAPPEQESVAAGGSADLIERHSWRLLLPVLLLVLLIGAGAFYAESQRGSSHHTAGAAPTSRPAPTATQQPKPTATPPPKPTSRPAVQPSATAGPPTSTPGPAPTATAQPQATTAPTASLRPTGAPVAYAGSPGPAQAVKTFYALVAQHRFNAAAALWAPSMWASFTRSRDLNGRFAGTRAIAVNQARVTSRSAGAATVAVDIVEQTAAGADEIAGSWSLKRTNGRWLLAWPSLHYVSG